MEANNKAMREALSEIVLLTVKAGKSISCDVACGIIASKAKHALKQPQRNCDVGSPDEQAERFEDFCLKHTGCAEETGGKHCVGCPLEKASKHTTQKCELYWAQLPYEDNESGAK